MLYVLYARVSSSASRRESYDSATRALMFVRAYVLCRLSMRSYGAYCADLVCPAGNIFGYELKSADDNA